MSVDLEQRLTALEKQVARLQKEQKLNGANGHAWLEDLYGKFADDPIFLQAMKLGRKYRKSLSASIKTKSK